MAYPGLNSLLLLLVVISLNCQILLAAPSGEAQRRKTALPNAVPPAALPPWTYAGCYTDISTARTLSATPFRNTTVMSVKRCLVTCRGYPYAGTEYGKECYCGYALGTEAVLVDNASCNIACTENSREACGGRDFISVYADVGVAPSTPATVGHWVYDGCFTDSIYSRTFPHAVNPTGGVSIESCTRACNGYAFAGLEYSNQCYCGNSTASATLTPNSDCLMACEGNRREYCGDSNRLTVYRNTA